MPARPRIGITTSLTEGEQRLSHDYVRAVELAGGLPLPVPMLRDEATATAFAQILDGLVVTGGPAITEGLVGELPADIAPTHPIRSRSDRFLLAYALEHDLPVLGICYGMQLLNALAGGTLYADVQSQAEGSVAHSDKRGGPPHPLRIHPDTHLYRLIDAPDLVVNTRHLQAIAEPGRGYRVAARAPDGVVEAIEREDGRVLGVQFHPEKLGASFAPLFQHLVRLSSRVPARAGEHSAPVPA